MRHRVHAASPQNTCGLVVQEVLSRPVLLERSLEVRKHEGTGKGVCGLPRAQLDLDVVAEVIVISMPQDEHLLG